MKRSFWPWKMPQGHRLARRAFVLDVQRLPTTSSCALVRLAVKKGTGGILLISHRVQAHGHPQTQQAQPLEGWSASHLAQPLPYLPPLYSHCAVSCVWKACTEIVLINESKKARRFRFITTVSKLMNCWTPKSVAGLRVNLKEHIIHAFTTPCLHHTDLLASTNMRDYFASNFWNLKGTEPASRHTAYRWSTRFLSALHRPVRLHIGHHIHTHCIGLSAHLVMCHKAIRGNSELEGNLSAASTAMLTGPLGSRSESMGAKSPFSSSVSFDSGSHSSRGAAKSSFSGLDAKKEYARLFLFRLEMMCCLSNAFTSCRHFLLCEKLSYFISRHNVPDKLTLEKSERMKIVVWSSN